MGSGLLDGVVVHVDLAGGVSDDQIVFLQEAQDAPAAGPRASGGHRADVGLGDGGLGAEPGKQQVQGPGGLAADPLGPGLGAAALLELLQQLPGARGEGRQRAGVDAAPVPRHGEQRALVGVHQVGRGRPGGTPALDWRPGPVAPRLVAQRPGGGPKPTRQRPAEPQLDPGLGQRLRAVLADMHAAAAAQPIADRQPRSATATTGAGLVRTGPLAAALAERPQAPRAAVLAAAERGGSAGDTGVVAGAELARAPQDLPCGVGEVGQVVEGLLTNEVVTVGVADSQRQPQHPADPAPPRGTVMALGGVGDGHGLDSGPVAQLPAADPLCVGVGELARPPQ